MESKSEEIPPSAPYSPSDPPPPYHLCQNAPYGPTPAPGDIAFSQPPYGPFPPAYGPNPSGQPHPTAGNNYPDPVLGQTSPGKPYPPAGYNYPIPVIGHPSPGKPYPPAGYNYPGPVIGQPSSGQPVHRVSNQQQAVVIEQVSSSNVSMAGAICLGCCTFWCCGILFGAIAIILAFIGHCAASSGNIQNAVQLRNASYTVSIVGIAIGVVFTAIFFFARR